MFVASTLCARSTCALAALPRSSVTSSKQNKAIVVYSTKNIKQTQCFVSVFPFRSNKSPHKVAVCMAAEGQDPIVSPFETIDDTTIDEPEIPVKKKYDSLTVANVETVLDRVRPYLISDGGNVSLEQVVEEAGIVSLKLEGACGSCPSSQQTLKLGIEAELKDAFGDLLKSVQEVSMTKPATTVQIVDKFLDQLRPAISNYGGTLEVLSVEDAVCNIKYKGPPMIAEGVRDAVKEMFKDDIDTVTILLVPEDPKEEDEK